MSTITLLPDEREAFEAFAREYGTWDIKRDDVPQLGIASYTDVAVVIAWHAWLARAALAATPAAAAPVVLPEPATPAHTQALHLARRTLHAIAKTYDDGELRTQALEADEAIDRLMSPAPKAPVEPASLLLTEQDAILLNQAIELLEDLSGEKRRRGDDSTAAGAACSAHAVQRLGAALLAGVSAPAAQAVPLKLIEAINTASGGNEWQGDALATDLLDPACRAIASLAPQAQEDAREALTPAARDVLAERARQISAEGWTPERDDQYVHGDLATAAGCYAMWTLAFPAGDPVYHWPWPKEWWKPSKDRRRNRVKAAALLLAEIERIDRAAIAAEKVIGRTPAHYLVDEHYPTETSERGAAAQADE